jgi:cyclase
MIVPVRYSRRLAILLALSALGLVPEPRSAQEAVTVEELAPNLLVLATRSGNIIASVGPDGALLVGTPSVADTPRIEGILAQRTKSPVRYVVIVPQDLAHSEGDAGWGKRGAFVAMQENALRRLGGNVMGAPPALPSRLVKLGVDRPRVAFSEVLAFDINGDSIHFVRQKPGYSDWDTLAHFHVANVFYLGEMFPGDGYPKIDAAQGGTLSGLLEALVWTDVKQRIVPARGKVVDGTALKAYRDMIVTVRDRIQRLIDRGRTANQVVAAHPTADFDAQWGQGRVQPDAFAREIYTALKKR